VGFIIFARFLKLLWWVLLGMVWLGWAMVALTVALFASAAGRKHAARKWTHTARWGRAR
jgi:hypothetical protein